MSQKIEIRREAPQAPSSTKSIQIMTPKTHTTNTSNFVQTVPRHLSAGSNNFMQNQYPDLLATSSASLYQSISNATSSSLHSPLRATEFENQPDIIPELGPYIDTFLVQWFSLKTTRSIVSDILTGKVPQIPSQEGTPRSPQNTHSPDQNNNTIPKNQSSINPDETYLKTASTPTSISPRSTAGIKLPSSAGKANNEHSKHLVRQKSSVSAQSSLNRASLSESFRVQSAAGEENCKRRPQIPKFYFPFGETHKTQSTLEEDVQASLQKIKDVFSSLPGGRIARLNHMDKIAKACNCPLYWRRALFNAVGGHRAGQITSDHFLQFWENIIRNYHDTASKFVAIVETQRKNSEKTTSSSNSQSSSTIGSKESSHYLEFHDFMPVIQDVVDTHPGLSFLLQAPEFHCRYIQTVICRIFYNVNRSWTGRITISEIRQPMGLKFLNSLEQLSEIPDINEFTWFFSYQHFYVIYCKFWDLDKDHDLIVSQDDLLEYCDTSLTNKIVSRLVSGCVTRWSGSSSQKKTMEYRDFVWFLLAENDKYHPTSIEYWFRVLDLDGDGTLSLYELEYFYEEQAEKMLQLDIEPLAFDDIACLAIDSIGCHNKSSTIHLPDLKKSKNCSPFFDTFVNTNKYLENEHHEPSIEDYDDMQDAINKVLPYHQQSVTAWEKYCAEEYRYLANQEEAQNY